ncbi:MAG: ADP-heptose--LPS heptosyltransferase [Verrucomicrobia bacterium]|nr:ADP-heptose--LPS heptosyltransferase [Verrucomicrobiota bacterium]
MQANDRAALEKIAAPDPVRARLLGDAWLRHMERGDFEAAWRVSDEVLRLRRGRDCTHLPRHFQWVWDGRSLAGKRVLIRCYHGLGDTVQFIRYAPLVKQIAARVNVWGQPELLPLLRTMQNAFDELLPLHDGTPDCDFELDIELMELPHAFRSTASTVPASIPYFHVTPAAISRSDNLHVGLVWAAGDWDERRSIPFEIVQQLAQAPGVTWHILQRGPALAEWNNSFGVNSGTDDVLQAARVIAALDLLISVDTLPAHLGGALGIPIWTLLHAQPDWRWMSDRADSPWYPTMRLFRQGRAGDWRGVLAEVQTQLRLLSY